MTRIAIPTASQFAAAEQLLAEPARWTAARRKIDGRPFFIIRGKSGVYYCDATACTCRGFAYRGCCSYAIAAKLRTA